MGVPIHNQNLTVVQQAVHGSARQERIAEERVPLLHIPVGSDDRRAPFVAQPDDFIEVAGLIVLEGMEAKVIYHRRLTLMKRASLRS